MVRIILIRNKCNLCGSVTKKVMDYGEVVDSGVFLKDLNEIEVKHPLTLWFCESCNLLQIGEHLDRDSVFRNYFYYSSATRTMKDHFSRLASEIAGMEPKLVVEIGCNDGVLLKPLAKHGIRSIGIDPSNTVHEIDDPLIEIINDYFRGGLGIKADVVVANNVFAHVPDINGMTEDIMEILKEDGVFMLEVNKLDSLVSGLQYDWVYHEHLYYYSLMTLMKHFERFGMEVFNFKRLAHHAGSMRVYVGFRGKHKISEEVQNQVDRERWYGLDKVETFYKFAARAEEHRIEMRKMVNNMVGTIAGYGACGRTNTMLQYCGLDSRRISYIVDDAPAKQGFYTPGTHIPIRSSENLDADHLIVFAWSFLEEIEKKYNKEMIIPLPYIYTYKR